MKKKIDVNIGRMVSRTMEKETDKKRKETKWKESLRSKYRDSWRSFVVGGYKILCMVYVCLLAYVIHSPTMLLSLSSLGSTNLPATFFPVIFAQSLCTGRSSSSMICYFPEVWYGIDPVFSPCPRSNVFTIIVLSVLLLFFCSVSNDEFKWEKMTYERKRMQDAILYDNASDNIEHTAL